MASDESSGSGSQEMANALFSIYYHCEIESAKQDALKAGRAEPDHDPASLPADYNILPLDDALSAFPVNEAPIHLVRFILPVMVRAWHGSLSRISESAIMNMADAFFRKLHPVTPATPGEGERAENLSSAFKKLFSVAGGTGPSPDRAQDAFLTAYRLVNDGKKLENYTIRVDWNQAETT
jgi:hypothetical protein